MISNKFLNLEKEKHSRKIDCASSSNRDKFVRYTDIARERSNWGKKMHCKPARRVWNHVKLLLSDLRLPQTRLCVACLWCIDVTLCIFPSHYTVLYFFHLFFSSSQLQCKNSATHMAHAHIYNIYHYEAHVSVALFHIP